MRSDLKLDPLLWGGFQQQGLRPGTESVSLAVGMHVVLQCFQREAELRQERISRLRDRFEAAMLRAWPQAVVHGKNSNDLRDGQSVERMPGTSNISFSGLDRQALLMAFDMAGVACSTGSACASGSREPSPTLMAMGLADSLVNSSLRFSLGATTTEAEIDDAAGRIGNVLKRCKEKN